MGFGGVQLEFVDTMIDNVKLMIFQDFFLVENIAEDLQQRRYMNVDK
jgi:hypothetical protein